MKKTLILTLLIFLASLGVMGKDPKKKKAGCEVSQPTGVVNNHGYVDLGLTVMWATCNVGATSPEEFGQHYAWGETEPKDDYTWRTYKWGKREYDMTKYCTYSDYGPVDYKVTLEAEDDVAHVKWGNNWHMPSIAEAEELLDKCKWKWTKLNGVRGYMVTSKINGNSIFLPAAGIRGDVDISSFGKIGCYWLSAVHDQKPYNAKTLSLFPNSSHTVSLGRCGGFSIRPVYSKIFSY